MNDEERDMDAESNEDRARHNAMERSRRDQIKYSYIGLRDALPDLQGTKASRIQILTKATDYIQALRCKNAANRRYIEELKDQNQCLALRIRNKITAMKTAKTTNGGDSGIGGSTSDGNLATTSNRDESVDNGSAPL